MVRIAKIEEQLEHAKDVRTRRVKILDKFKRWGYRSLQLAEKIYIRNGILGSEFIG